MAKQKPGVYDRVLECAKEEFSSKGFLNASLRAIAQEAGTSTGSIYTRFGDKEGTVPGHCRTGGGSVQSYVPRDPGELPPARQRGRSRRRWGRYTARHQVDLLDYIYDHFNVFQPPAGRGPRHPVRLFPGRAGGHRGGVHLPVHGGHSAARA